MEIWRNQNSGNYQYMERFQWYRPQFLFGSPEILNITLFYISISLDTPHAPYIERSINVTYICCWVRKKFICFSDWLRNNIRKCTANHRINAAMYTWFQNERERAKKIICRGELVSLTFWHSVFFHACNWVLNEHWKGMSLIDILWVCICVCVYYCHYVK